MNPGQDPNTPAPVTPTPTPMPESSVSGSIINTSAPVQVAPPTTETPSEPVASTISATPNSSSSLNPVEQALQGVDFNQNNPSPVDQANVSDASNQSVGKKGNKTGLIIAIVVAAVVIIAGVVVAILLISGAFGGGKDVEKYTANDVLLIGENNNGGGKQAIFKSSGEQVTDYIYNNGDSFVNGHTMVTLVESGEVGVINQKGEATIEFGKYDLIRDLGALYAVADGDSWSLVTANGKKVSDFEESREVIFNEYSPYVYVKNKDDKFDLYDVDGNIVETVEDNDDPAIGTDRTHDYIAVAKSQNTTVYRAGSGEKVQEITTDAKTYPYILDMLYEDSSIIILGDEEDDAKASKYAYYRGETGKIPNDCKEPVIGLNKSLKQNRYITCDAYDHHLTPDFEYSDAISNDDFALITSSDYVKYDYSGTKLSFYTNNREVAFKEITGQKAKDIAAYGDQYHILAVNNTDKKISVIIYDMKGEKSKEVALDYDFGDIYITGLEVSDDYYFVESYNDARIFNKDGKPITITGVEGEIENIVIVGDDKFVRAHIDGTPSYSNSYFRVDKSGKVTEDSRYMYVMFSLNEPTYIFGGNTAGHINDDYDNWVDLNGAFLDDFKKVDFVAKDVLKITSKDKVEYYNKDGKKIK